MQQKRIPRIIISVFLFLLVAPLIVSAQNVSFSTLGQLGDEDILIYEYNGTAQNLYGMWNTSSPYIELPDNDFNIVVRPSAQGRFTPALFLADGFAYVESNAIPIVILIFLVGLLFAKR
jgi:hypothetical protein